MKVNALRVAGALCLYLESECRRRVVDQHGMAGCRVWNPLGQDREQRRIRWRWYAIGMRPVAGPQAAVRVSLNQGLSQCRDILVPGRAQF